MPRITPAEPPYEPEIAAALERIMPPGVPPLVLFRTMARSPRVFAKMFAGGLLDKGPLSLRQREIVIDRTTARLGCEYEWGVHIALFAERAGFTPEHVAATVVGRGDAACWTPDEQALISAGRRSRRPPHHRRQDMGRSCGALRRGADPRGDRAGRLLPHDQLPVPWPRPAAGKLRRALPGAG